jgi:hypothetical protein
MPAGNLGPLLALLGLVLLLVRGLSRQRARQRRLPAGAGVSRWSGLSALVAYALILAGLWLMWAQK